MSLYKIVLSNNGDRVREYNARGSCTGVFQTHGKFWSEQQVWTDAKVSFYHSDAVSKKFLEGVVNSRLIQALVPGLSLVDFVSDREYGEAASFMIINFPGADTVTADSAVSAMRLINCWASNHYREITARLLEHELTVEEMMVLGWALFAHPTTSDSSPVLWRMKKRDCNVPADVDSYMGTQLIQRQKSPPMMGMLLPLIRGEVSPGNQSAFNKGYWKEHALHNNVLGRNDYNSRGVYEAMSLDSHLTVNNPLILDTAENLVGPALSPDFHTNIRNIPWLLDRLGK